MKLTKKSETSSKITFTYDKPSPETEGYIYYANDVAVSRTFNPNDLEVTFGKVPSGRYAVDAVGFEELDRAEWPEVTPEPEPEPEPTPTGDLRWKPPGYPDYPGFVRLTANNANESLNLDNSKDYVIKLGTKQWSSGGGRTMGLAINGGRHVVIIGGSIQFNSTNSSDDSVGLMVDGGADGGIVHVEGVTIKACNAITMRTRRMLQLQNSRLEVYAYKDDYSSGSGIHPDLLQVWATSLNHAPSAGIRFHKVTCHTSYQGLSVLCELSPKSVGGARVNPVFWERYEVDIHPRTNLAGKKDAASYFVHCDSETGETNGPYTAYSGEVYAELPTGGNGAYVRGIDDISIICSLLSSPAKFFPFELHTPNGATVYTSPNPPTGGTGSSAARTAGNYLTFSRVPALAPQKLIVGNPPGGEFCPASVPGPSYVSPGYR